MKYADHIFEIINAFSPTSLRTMIGGEYSNWKQCGILDEANPAKWIRMNDCTFGWGDSIADGVFMGL